MKQIYYTTGIAVILLGILHTVLTTKFFPQINTDALWFMSAGLTLIFAGIANLMNLHSHTNFTFRSVMIINIILVIFTLFLSLIESKPTTIVVAVCSILLLVASFINHVKYNR